MHAGMHFCLSVCVCVYICVCLLHLYACMFMLMYEFVDTTVEGFGGGSGGACMQV